MSGELSITNALCCAAVRRNGPTAAGIRTLTKKLYHATLRLLAGIGFFYTTADVYVGMKSDKNFKNLLVDIGNGLAALRVKKGYTTIKAFTEKYDLPEIQYWRIEKGKANVTLKSLSNFVPRAVDATSVFGPWMNFDGIGTFRTDVGLGLDIGLFGVYVAQSISHSKEPANVFVRIRDRF